VNRGELLDNNYITIYKQKDKHRAYLLLPPVILPWQRKILEIASKFALLPVGEVLCMDSVDVFEG
jgi:hypothetical protein